MPPKDVFHRFFPGVGIEALFEFLQREVVVLRKKILQIEHGLFPVAGGGIDLNPVTGGENHVLSQ